LPICKNKGLLQKALPSIALKNNLRKYFSRIILQNYAENKLPKPKLTPTYYI
jgi:hypothetical protein